MLNRLFEMRIKEETCRWTRTTLKQLLRRAHSGTFPLKPQMTLQQPDGTSLECYQTYANRLFAVIKDGKITKVYYGMGFST
jgi:hypothetical protein